MAEMIFAGILRFAIIDFPYDELQGISCFGWELFPSAVSATDHLGCREA